METTENMEDPSVGHMEEEAKARKERLKALRQKLQGGRDDQSVVIKPTNISLPKPVFRSYNPQTEELQEAAKPKAKPIDIEDQVADTVQQGQVKTLLDEVDLSNLAPRKPDWDLKRDVAPQLQKLERRTQRAIAELILDRLKASQDVSQLTTT